MEKYDRTEDQLKKLKSDLETKGIDYDEIGDSTKKRLFILDNAMTELENDQHHLHMELSRKYASMNRIEEMCGISKKTLKSNPVLYEYYKLRKKRYEDKDMRLKINRLQKRISNLQDINRKLYLENTKLVHNQDENIKLSIELDKSTKLCSKYLKIIKTIKTDYSTVDENNSALMISWNVNGFRSRFSEIKELLFSRDVDIICLQEIKTNNIDDIEGYTKYISKSSKQGYAGVAVYIKEPLEPIRIVSDYDEEGRILFIELNDCVLINVYVPRVSNLDRYSYRINFDNKLKDIVEEQKKDVILCGDFNAVSGKLDTIVDIDNNDENEKYASRRFNTYMGTGLTDAFRKCHPGVRGYTFGYKSRLDYILTNREILSSDILDFGSSDHKPVDLIYRI